MIPGLIKPTYKSKASYAAGKVLKAVSSRAPKPLQKAGKAVSGVIKRTKAVGQLYSRLKNPRNQFKMVKNLATGKGLTLPGSKYIGPGNPMNRGKPVDKADANAYQHDVDYDNYIKRGVKKRHVYTGYSDADERLLKNTKADTPNGLAVNLGIGAKKALNKLGLTKRIRDKDVYGK